MVDEVRVVAIVEAKKGYERDVAAAISACVGPTRREPGCRFYTAHTDLAEPSRFVFVERWDNQAALAEHETSPHFVAMAEAFKTLLERPLQVLVLRELD